MVHFPFYEIAADGTKFHDSNEPAENEQWFILVPLSHLSIRSPCHRASYELGSGQKLCYLVRTCPGLLGTPVGVQAAVYQGG